MTPLTGSSTTSWRRHSVSVSRHARRSTDWPAICAEDLRVVGDPLEIALARAPTISREWAQRLLSGEPTGPPPALDAWLLPHQREAARRLFALLERWGGAVLADAPGLGKTYVALALARACGGSVTVIAPASLRDQWLETARRAKASIAFATTESLSRGHEPPEAAFVVVDEAHHFRNPLTRRYGVLARWIASRETLLLTATPVVNRVADLVALLKLFLPDDALRAAGITSLGELRRRPACLQRVWRLVAVARDAREARVTDALPRRRLVVPLVRSTVAPDRLATLVALIDALETPGAEEPRALLQLLLYRALASSAAALAASARHHERFVARASEAARHGLALPRRAFRQLVAQGDPDQLAFLPLLLDPAGPGADQRALGRDQQRLEHLAAGGEGADPKAQALLALLADRQAESKAVVFVNSVVTARYLARRVPGAVALTGAGGWTLAGRLPTRDALSPFRPHAGPPPHLDARVLIATDVAGEGLDLQGASLVVHYDLPWTPARLAQRSGRVHRLGSPHHSIEEQAFLPVEPLAERLRIVERLLDKERAGRAANRPIASPGAVLHARPPRARRVRRADQAPVALLYRLEVGGYSYVGALPRLPRAAVIHRVRSLVRTAASPVAPPAPVVRARRILLDQAGRAARQRSPGLLVAVERALGRLGTALRAGELLLLEDALAAGRGRLRHILAWAERMRERPVGLQSLELFLVGEDVDRLA